MIPLLNIYPHSGLTRINVRFRSSFSSVVLINAPATPEVDFFVQSTAIYTGSDAVAFHAKYSSPVTPIVSLQVAISLRIC